GPPDVSYSYISLGVGAIVPLGHWLALHGRFNYHALLGQGPINALTEYGNGGANGLRFVGGVEVRVGQGIVARVEGFYERFSLSFDTMSSADKTANSAVDAYYGGLVSVGYVWRKQTPVAKAPPPVTDGDGDGVPDAEDLCPNAAGPRATG